MGPREESEAEMEGRELAKHLEKVAYEAGARVYGVADLEKAEEGTGGIFERLGATFARGIVMGMPLSAASIEQVVESPTPLYFHAYRQLNYRLDTAAFLVAQALLDSGERVLAVAASQMIGKEPPRGHISHRHVAQAAGVGWIGRSGLLVTPRYGARVRLVTVLTDAELDAGEAMEFACGKCVACIKVCPAQAIGKTPEDYDLGACYGKLTEFTRIPYVGQHICGVCVKACAPENRGRAVDEEGNKREV